MKKFLYNNESISLGEAVKIAKKKGVKIADLGLFIVNGSQKLTRKRNFKPDVKAEISKLSEAKDKVIEKKDNTIEELKAKIAKLEQASKAESVIIEGAKTETTEVSKMKADEVKKLATSLGIDFKGKALKDVRAEIIEATKQK